MSRADSPALRRLLGIADRLGYRVEFLAAPEIDFRPSDPGSPPPPDMQATGHVDYLHREIVLALDDVSPLELVLTLAHELGHALAAERMGYGLRAHNDDWLAALWALSTGERRAYVYGWAVLVSVGLAPDPVTRELWRLHHLDNWDAIAGPQPTSLPATPPEGGPSLDAAGWRGVSVSLSTPPSDSRGGGPSAGVGGQP